MFVRCCLLHAFAFVTCLLFCFCYIYFMLIFLCLCISIYYMLLLHVLQLDLSLLHGFFMFVTCCLLLSWFASFCLLRTKQVFCVATVFVVATYFFSILCCAFLLTDVIKRLHVFVFEFVCATTCYKVPVSNLSLVYWIVFSQTYSDCWRHLRIAPLFGKIKVAE